MKRISTATRVVDKFGAGKHGFTNGDVVAGVPATDLEADLFDHLQEELANIVEGSGIVLDGAVRTQVLQAVRRLFGGNVTTVNFAASPFALTADHAGLVLVDATAGNVVINLSAANVLASLQYHFVRIDSSVNAATVNRAGADTIDGTASFTLTGLYDFRSIAASGAALWLTLSQKPPTQLLPTGTQLMWPVPTAPSWALVRDGAAVSRATYANLFAVLCPTRNMTTANGTKNLTGISSTTDLYVGMPIEGAGIVAGAVIETITGATTATMTLGATASATVPVRLFYFGYGSGGSAATFGLPDDRGLFERGLDTGSRVYDQSVAAGNTTNASNVINGMASTRGLFIGMAVTGAGIPASTTVTEITSGVAIKISANATATVSAVALTFTGGQIGSEKSDDFKSHTHPPLAGTSIISFSTGAGSGDTNGAGSNLFFNVTTGARGGAETRPRFRTYLPIIAY